MNTYQEIYQDEEYYTLNEPRIKTVSEWEIILKNELERNSGFDFIHKVLVEMYKIEDFTIFCGEFERTHDIGGLNLRVGEFRDRIRKMDGIHFPEQIRLDSNSDRAWNIPFKSSEEVNEKIENKGHFCWILREELIEAMERVMPYIKEYRQKYSLQYAPLEYHDNAILNKAVVFVDSEMILSNARKGEPASPKSSLRRLPPKIDYTKKQIRNKILGDSGEHKVLKEEQARLKSAGKYQLAREVHIVDSDAYGYDIVSYNEDGTPKHIEVKTSTSTSDDVAFHITAYEVQTLLEDDAYELHYLYCVNEQEIKKVIFTNEQLRTQIIQRYMQPTQFVVNIKTQN